MHPAELEKSWYSPRSIRQVCQPPLENPPFRLLTGEACAYSRPGLWPFCAAAGPVDLHTMHHCSATRVLKAHYDMLRGTVHELLW